DLETAKRLVATADVVIDNFRSREVMERLGLGYDVMRAINPRVIYLQSSAYGSRGPMDGMMSNEWKSQAASGYTSLNGAPGGRQEFMRGSAALDWNGAMINCLGLLVALYHREESGRGLCLETNQFQSSITAGITRWAEFFATGRAPERLGSARPNIVPDQAFSTALGYLSVAVVHDGIWPRVCRAAGRADLLADPRFSTNTARVEHRDALIPLLEATFRKRAAVQWVEALRAERVPCAEYLADRPRTLIVRDHPQVRANGMMQTIATNWGPGNVSAGHWRFSKNTTSVTRGSPAHGEHQAEVLAGLGATTATAHAVVPLPESAASGRLALQGLKVLDVSQGVPGALCAMALGDLGAEVIKVEPPDGDWLRTIGPFVAGQSALFAQLNRNKRGVTLDLKSEAGRAGFLRLVSGADIVIEGYRPGVMDRLGVGYQALAPRNPRLVYCSISGYGSAGPLADQPASELDIQAIIGKNRALGVAGAPPLRVGFDLVSVNAGWAAAQGVVAALYQRRRSGEGQRVETSRLDAAVAIMQWTTGAESNPDEWIGRPLKGYTEPPDHGYLSRDMPFLMDLGRGDDEFRRLCEILGLDHLPADPRFCGFRERAFNEQQLKDTLNPVLSQWDYEDLRALIQNALGGTIVPMHNLASLAEEPQVAALDIMHPLPEGGIAIALPWRFSEPIGRLGLRPAPRLGEHNAA
ncbi:MAG: CoA transferase, partial [Chloroflexota bacterium]